MVLKGEAIVKDLSETAIPIVLKPTSRPTRICDVRSCSIKLLGFSITGDI